MTLRPEETTLQHSMLSCLRGRVRHVSTTLKSPLSTRASETYTHPSNTLDAAVSTTPHDITPEQRRALDAALRVDQAGELAANWIYRGQMVVLGKHPKLGPLIQVGRHASFCNKYHRCELIGHVGPRKASSGRDGQAASAAPGATNNSL